MLKYITKRLANAFLMLGLASIAVFIAVHYLPGDPVTIMLGDSTSSSSDTVAKMRASMGLDQPVYVQLKNWAVKGLSGDLGDSIRTGEPVVNELLRRIPRSLELIGAGLLIAVLLGIPLGVIAANYRSRFAGIVSSIISVAGFSSPTFVTGIVLALIFSLWLGWLPPSGYVSLASDPLRHFATLILPAFTIGINFMGVVARMMRASLLDTLSKDYVTLARAKGLPMHKSIIIHALPNALIPVITIVGVRAGNLLGGTVIIEALFDWPGLSSLLLSAAFARDYPIIQGSLVAIFGLFILISLIVDLLHAWLDPKVRSQA